MTDAAPVDGMPEKPKFGKQQIIATILTIGILLLMVVVVLPQLGDYDQAWAAIQSMENWHFVLIILATIALIFIYVLPYTAAFRV